jgi:hypothetical protein
MVHIRFKILVVASLPNLLINLVAYCSSFSSSLSHSLLEGVGESDDTLSPFAIRQVGVSRLPSKRFAKSLEDEEMLVKSEVDETLSVKDLVEEDV